MERLMKKMLNTISGKSLEATRYKITAGKRWKRTSEQAIKKAKEAGITGFYCSKEVKSKHECKYCGKVTIKKFDRLFKPKYPTACIPKRNGYITIAGNGYIQYEKK